MHQNKSLFIDEQIPGFILEEYPLFAEFIKQYYLFLEQEAGKIIAVKVLSGGSNYNPIVAWAANTTFKKGSRVVYPTNGGNVYLITSTSTSNNTPPTHTSGNVSFYTFISANGGATSVSVSFQVKDQNTQQFINDPRTGASKAAASALIVSGSIDKIIVTNFGSNYTEEDEVKVVVSGGGGSGALLEVVTTTKLGNINSAIAQTINSRDIDESIPEFVDLIRKELIPQIPQKLYRDDNATNYNEVDVQKFIKFSKQFYKSKGTEKSIQFLFRILFNSDVSFYYPKTDMLRVSDGKWSVDKVIRITPTVTESNISIEEFRELYLGERIIGAISGATAIIQDIDNIAITGGGSLKRELKLSDINGEFNITGESILLFKLDNSKDIVVGSAKRCIQSLKILTGGIGYKIGDQITSTNSFLAKVTSVDDTGKILDYKIDNFGFDYASTPVFTTNVVGASGATFEATLGVLLVYEGIYIGTDGQLSSAKKIQDSEYYQDFSYEIVSDQSANIFGQFLNTMIHPAGLKLFSKILSIKEDSLYLDRYNFNPTLDNYTYIVDNNDTAITDFFIVKPVLNTSTSTAFQSGLAVAFKTIISIVANGLDYLFEVSTAGTLGSTQPSISIVGPQVNDTASLIFIGVSERPASVFLNGKLQRYSADNLLPSDFTFLNANTIRFNSIIKPGSVVRIVVRRDALFTTDYNEYIKSYTKIDIRRIANLREPFFMYSWFAGLPSSPIAWTESTSYSINNIIQHLGNYYIAMNNGTTGKTAPTFPEGLYSNGSLLLKYFNYHIGYIGDIIYYGSNFYKVTGTTNANISGIFGQTAPTHTSGTVVNGKLLLTYHNPGFKFWSSGSSALVGDIILYINPQVLSLTPTATGSSGASTIVVSSATNIAVGQSVTGTGIGAGAKVVSFNGTTLTLSVANTGTVSGTILIQSATSSDFYKVIKSGNLGSTPPSHENGSYPNGTTVLAYHTYNYSAQTKIVHVSQLDPGKAMLGPTVNDIERNAYSEMPQFFQDFIGTKSGLTPGSTFSTIIFNDTGLSVQDDEYIHYSIIITFSNGVSAGNKLVRAITNYNGSTKTFTLGSSVTLPSGCTDIQYRLLQNFIVSSYNSGTKNIGLSTYDPAYNLNPVIKTKFEIVTSTDVNTTTDTILITNHGLTDRTKLTYDAYSLTVIGGLTTATNYYVKVVDVDNIRLCSTYSNAVNNIYVNITSTGSGSQYFYLQNNLYQYYNLIITSGGGVNSVLNIAEYNEINNTITFENDASGTIVPGESTYFIYPDLYNGSSDGSGPNEDFYSSSIIELFKVSGGSNYQIGDTITFTGGYGSSASASISSVDAGGQITLAVLNSGGYGYIYSPIVSVNTSTGSGASFYPILSPVAGIGVESYYKYSTYGNYIYNLDYTYRPTTKFEYGETVQQQVTGISVGQSVSGTNIGAGAKVSSISVSGSNLSTLTLSVANSGVVANNINITSDKIAKTVTATGSSGASTIVVSNVTGVVAGQSVSGTNIGAGATISSISGTTLTLSVANTGTVANNVNITSDGVLKTVTATGASPFNIVVTNATGIAVGQNVAGSNIGVGATVSSINGNTITLSVANTGAINGSVTIASGAYTATGSSGFTITVSNKARIIKHDSHLKLLYLESDEESDALNLTLDLIRVKDSSIIDTTSGELLYSGWRSTNIPVGSITKTYKK